MAANNKGTGKPHTRNEAVMKIMLEEIEPVIAQADSIKKDLNGLIQTLAVVQNEIHADLHEMGRTYSLIKEECTQARATLSELKRENAKSIHQFKQGQHVNTSAQAVKMPISIKITLVVCFLAILLSVAYSLYS